MINNSYNAPTLLKQIFALTYIDTTAKAFHIHNSLIDMKQQMTKTSSNIVFNDWVCNQVGQLHASGEEGIQHRLVESEKKNDGNI